MNNVLAASGLCAAAIICVSGSMIAPSAASAVSVAPSSLEIAVVGGPNISPPVLPSKDVPPAAATINTPPTETVVVVAGNSGPAVWHVRKGNSEVWILGTVLPVPKDLKWDSRGIGALLQGARVLMLPPRAEIGLFEGLWFAVSDLGSLEQPEGMTLENSLDGPLRERFIAARMRAHREASRYAKYLPAVAALRLEIDSRDPAGLTMDEPEQTVSKLASHAGVPIRSIAIYRFLDVVHDLPAMSMPVQRTCLKDALDDIDAEAARAGAAAEAWAHGDVKGAIANSPENELETCLRQSPSFNTIYERGIADTVGAIVDALNSPGKTVVIVPMAMLLSTGGVLARIPAEGQPVVSPPL